MRSNVKRISGLAVIAALTLAACGGDDGGSTTTEAPSTEAPSTEAPSTEAPAAEGWTVDTSACVEIGRAHV